MGPGTSQPADADREEVTQELPTRGPSLRGLSMNPTVSCSLLAQTDGSKIHCPLPPRRGSTPPGRQHRRSSALRFPRA
eukprot:534949-Pyramimonas_sp.AAC.1